MKSLIVLLAAGRSRRFNGAKLAQVIDREGTSILEDSYSKLWGVANKVGAELLVILGGHQEQLLPLLPAGAKYLINSEFKTGLSSSIRCAVNHGVKTEADSLLISLADQVAITESDYLSLYRARGGAPVCATFDEQLSAPALFYRDDFDKLAALKGDRGAKPILQMLKQVGRLQTVEMSSAQKDIDTRIELADWLDVRSVSRENHNN
ncbi:nucleotidyltransferase family protein [Shewanella woodyi]|uniref:Isoquinoline 1-oxidoreductase maturation factor n=1 Tax=Shewanella woodyi (strain ATCC 51908 / MS32) TaxID=392500 RepID=B1KKK7_SHEWM|nr:nucleotidyltransferase family protein [Shewanella woodyi]ACA87224.1 isoquinoline 1-oxidoreductase maturation factor [Shewanella woodyi ATCC 51908]